MMVEMKVALMVERRVVTRVAFVENRRFPMVNLV
jgi:hypothetical protein